ncbi:Conserved TM helix repeat-containing protein [Crinalium epipsammum PCC 9333]|uniref:Conserved TM helix repeat-containing protein n=1 Tax=Crinalium epipsammum PCC 9333 TaxID=1173022 RepID=K9VYQ2_9CYAN|nr:mechanosensitive ion channel [Crinalium epipsammum]AFZ12295.1 Conserved TM helix repeat-containing protein [Crinalium epipsammum PCC 9333]
MNEAWSVITQSINADDPLLWSQILAQATPAKPQPAISGGVSGLFQGLGFSLGPSLLNLVAAIAILVIGLIVALVASAITNGLLKRTDIDNRLAAWITGRSDSADTPPVEKWISSIVFWLVMILVLVAFLDQLKLTVVSQPLNNFLSQILGFLPKLGGAAILLGIAWVIATAVKLLVTRTLRTLRLDERLNQQVGSSTSPQPNQLSLSDTLANALYWFIFLLFLPSVLSTLELQGTLQPVQTLLNEVLAILPNILAAVLIGFAGWLLAQVVRRIVTNLLAATGTDQLGHRVGLNQPAGGKSLSWIIGTFVYVLILIPTAIAALNALRIDAISDPATSMLQQILNAIPQILTAALILALAYFLGRFVSDLVTNILTGLGFNNIFSWIGLPTQRPKAILPPSSAPEASFSTNTEFDSINTEFDPLTSQQATVIQPTPTITRTPSELAGIVVLVGIMLFATVAATNVLQIAALTVLVSGIVVVLGRILSGLVVFAIGLYLANLAYSLITSSGSRQSRILGQTARIAIIALVSAMALQQMGIASDIVNLAFGLLLGAIAVAIALAFGLGSRDVAAGQVQEWLDSFKQQR